MPRRVPTDRILEGLLRSLARQGIGRVSMTDVALEAGVSRGTLYRYFANLDALLTALGMKVMSDITEAIEKATADRPDLEDRLEVVLTTLRDFNRNWPELVRLTETEPTFSLGWFRQDPDALSRPIRQALKPLCGERTANQRRELTRLTDLVWRVAISWNIIPPGDDSAEPEWIARALTPYVRAG